MVPGGVSDELRRTRLNYPRAISLRRLARQEKLSATYLSRCECGYECPSERVLRIYADNFGADFDRLCKLAGRVPSDVARHLVDTPGAFERLRQEMDGNG